MASPKFSCNLNTLIQQSACFRPLCLSHSDRKAVDIHLKVRNLAAIGGTNYELASTNLVRDAAAWTVRSKEELEAIDLYIDWQNALDNGAVLEATPKGLIASPHCYRFCVGMKQLNGIQAYLKCAINTLGEPD